MLLPYRKWKKLHESAGQPGVSYITYTFDKYEQYDHIDVIRKFFQQFTNVLVTKLEKNDTGNNEARYTVILELDEDSDLGLLSLTGAAQTATLNITMIDVVKYVTPKLPLPDGHFIKQLYRKDEIFVYEVKDTGLSNDSVYSRVFSEESVVDGLEKYVEMHAFADWRPLILATPEVYRYLSDTPAVIEDRIIDALSDSKRVKLLEAMLATYIAKYFLCVYLREKVHVTREDVRLGDFMRSTRAQLEKLQSDLDRFDSKSDNDI
jgi:hypothetical protein